MAKYVELKSKDTFNILGKLGSQDNANNEFITNEFIEKIKIWLMNNDPNQKGS